MAPPAEVVAVVAQKGGSTRSTIVGNLGAALAQAGRRVLLLDLDEQATLTRRLGAEPAKELAAALLTDEQLDAGAVVGVELADAPGVLELLPSGGPWLARVERAHAGDPSAWPMLGKLLRALLRREAGRWSDVLIDTPPALGFWTSSAALAADALLVPCEPSADGLHGLRGVLDHAERIGARAGLRGIVAARVDRTRIASEVVERLRSRFGEAVFRTVVPERVAVREAAAQAVPVTSYRPTDDAAQAFHALAAEYQERSGRTFPARPRSDETTATEGDPTA